jgi:lauroyl/myristoyl acyltransferase
VARRVPIDTPWQLPAVPPAAYALHLPRILWYRLLPLRLTMRLAVLRSHAELWGDADFGKRIEAAIAKVLPPGTAPGDLRRLAILSRAVRRLGSHTYAPVARRSNAWLLRTFRPEGLETLDEVKRSGRGAIMLATHAGINGWITPILNQLGYQTLLMQRPNIALHRLITMKLDRWEAKVVPNPGPGNAGLHLKRLHDLLRQGQWLQYGGDTFNASGLPGTCLGHAHRFNPAPWMLGRLTGAALIPTLLLADERLRPRLIVGPSITVDPDQPPDLALAGALQEYLDFVTRHMAPVPWNFSHLTLARLVGLR